MDNTVGSLTLRQKSIITGLLLGDGYLRVIKNRKNAFLEINHSLSQKEYVDWKFKILENLSKSGPKTRGGANGRIAYRFYTRQHSELTELLSLFYNNGRKIIPPNLKLDPIMLSVWFMDDGSKCRQADVYLNTQQFSIEDQNLLIKSLQDLGLVARLNKDKIYYRIRFIKSSLPILKQLIYQYIIPSMRYKIEL